MQVAPLTPVGCRRQHERRRQRARRPQALGMHGRRPQPPVFLSACQPTKDK